MDLKHGGHIIQPEQSFLHSYPTDHFIVFVGKISLVSHSLSIITKMATNELLVERTKVLGLYGESLTRY